MRLSSLGFGGAQIGGLHAPVSEAQAQEALQAAWDHGIRYFDTAPLYGCGLSERRIGSFLSGKLRDEFTISTKVGRVLVPRSEVDEDRSGSLAQFHGDLSLAAVFDFSEKGVRASLEASLERLCLSRVDIAYIHDPDVHLEEAICKAYPALARLREEGLVGAIGAGMNDAAAMTTLVRACDLDVVLIAGRYTLLDKSAARDLLPICRARGVRVTAAGVFNSGILAQAEPSAGARYDYCAADAQTLARAQRIAAVCKRYGVSLRAAAIAFTLREPAVESALLGMRSAQEVRENVSAAHEPIPDDLWVALARESAA